MSGKELYDEKELLLRMANNDQRAFGILYDLYWNSLFTYVMRTIHSQPDAEDIIQEVFSSLWKRRQQLDIKGPVAGYLFSIARYLSIAYLESNVSQSKNLKALAELQQKVAVPEAEMAIRIQELQRQLDEAIDRLPPRMRDIFILSRKHQLSQKEIAALLGVSEQTVKKQIQHALKVVRPSLQLLAAYTFSYL